MGIRILDSTLNRGRNKSVKQSEQIMWEKNNFSSIGIVKSVATKTAVVKIIPSITYEEYDMKKGYSDVDTTNKNVTCLRVEGLSLVVDDIVVVIFTDLDSRKAIEAIQRGRSKSDNFNVSNKSFHSCNSGIIINKIII
jgi:hypothetical protein